MDLRFIFYGAHERDGTADLILTKDVLYRLSYMGAWSRRIFNPQFSGAVILTRNSFEKTGAGNGIRTRDPQLGRLML